ncbi:hypothetical protein GSI_11900 [Ganoderma sinense ZZ0214-1]|uniref:F-box domain-containing protein n=1 Tax=Ganoderma sinense ZZ0214-1 TaxID=1077348 RepID=A0A2G8RXA1_9APHY|nr:hypothetical protein GSI_11900 [Ganoderma sinense ZZ0214-1]
MKATSAVFRSFFSGHSPRDVPAFAFKIRSLTILLSPTSKDEKPSSNSNNAVLGHWVLVSRDLHHLRELAFLGTSVQSDARDLLVDLPPEARLRRFFCEDDSLLQDSSRSLLKHRETLGEFGGFFDTETFSPDMTPDTFLRTFRSVHTLDVGMRFIEQVKLAGSITNLSVRLEWPRMSSVVCHLCRTFGTQVRALRIERSAVVSGGWALVGDTWVPGPESPMLLCAYLDMPALRYLEVRDTAPPAAPEVQQEGIRPPGPSAWSFGDSTWMESSDYDGVQNLDRLAWRPAWAAKGGEHRDCADAFVRMAGDMLPVLTVWMSLEERTSGVWDTWTRIDEDFPLERKCVWDAVKEDSWKRMV